VEFKHGRKRQKVHDDIQLAAQAMCLEDMLGRPVRQGAIYHASSRRRREVAITPELRTQVEATANAIRAMLASGILPSPVNDERCRECSLKDICQPEALAATRKLHDERRHLFDEET
jgi:CRISPR-associated exonuclease Cas4